MGISAFGRRRWIFAAVSFVGPACLAASLLAERRVQAQAGGDAEEESRIRQGFAITPLPITLAGKNPALVGLGSYLVNAVSECGDCHTKVPAYLPGGNPFLGQPKQINPVIYLRGGRPFPAVDPTGVENPIVSRPLRPENGLPAGLTLDQFVDVMRNGTDYDHPGRLLQVMQWPIFQNMTDRDLLAIYMYLSTLPP
jgi:hypothetical protein